MSSLQFFGLSLTIIGMVGAFVCIYLLVGDIKKYNPYKDKETIEEGKVYIVFDDPESCDACPLFGNHYSDMCCKGTKERRTIDYPYPEDFKQDWCPLKDYK